MSKQEKSLKDENKASFYGVIVANLAVFYFVLQQDPVPKENFIFRLFDISSVVPLSAGVALTIVINALVPSSIKASIIFFKGKNALPGCRAFSYYAPRDSRIDISSLKEKYGALPSDPSEQNSLWYTIYRKWQEDQALRQTHKTFLFLRDYAIVSIIILLVLGATLLVFSPATIVRLLVVLGFVIQAVITLVAAHVQGVRLVTTVLSIESAKIQGAKYE